MFGNNIDSKALYEEIIEGNNFTITYYEEILHNLKNLHKNSRKNADGLFGKDLLVDVGALYKDAFLFEIDNSIQLKESCNYFIDNNTSSKEDDEYIKEMYLFKKIFEISINTTPETIYILSHNLIDKDNNNENIFYGDYDFYTPIFNFLKSGGKIEFIIKDPSNLLENDEHLFWNFYKTFYKNQVSAHYIVNQKKLAEHLPRLNDLKLIVSHNSYRIDETGKKAIFSFFSKHEFYWESNIKKMSITTLLQQIFNDTKKIGIENKWLKNLQDNL